METEAGITISRGAGKRTPRCVNRWSLVENARAEAHEFREQPAEEYPCRNGYDKQNDAKPEPAQRDAESNTSKRDRSAKKPSNQLEFLVARHADVLWIRSPVIAGFVVRKVGPVEG